MSHKTSPSTYINGVAATVALGLGATRCSTGVARPATADFDADTAPAIGGSTTQSASPAASARAAREPAAQTGAVTQTPWRLRRLSLWSPVEVATSVVFSLTSLANPRVTKAADQHVKPLSLLELRERVRREVRQALFTNA